MSFLDMPQVDDAASTTRSPIRRSRSTDVIVPSPLENLSIAPSRIALAKLEAKLVGEMDAHFRLKDKIEPIRDALSRTSSSTARRRWAC